MFPVIVNSVLDLIGNTPMLRLTRLNQSSTAVIYAKCEMFNPSLSIKDRIVLSMIRHYEHIGKLKPGWTIYESSSGNTGSSLAMIATLLGYKTVITVPQKTSQEKIFTMQAYGATVIICDQFASIDSPEHYSNKARILSEKTPKSLYFNQYDSHENVRAHYQYTATEIWGQMNGQVDYFVVSASSGGTITGVGQFLKEKNTEIKVILADPIGSVFYDYFYNRKLSPKNYQVEGAGKDKVCSIHDFSLIDEVIQFTDAEALEMTKKLALSEGLLVGGSSGGALAVAMKLANKLSNHDRLNIVVLFPDSGFKYMSKFSIS